QLSAVDFPAEDLIDSEVYDAHLIVPAPRVPQDVASSTLRVRDYTRGAMHGVHRAAEQPAGDRRKQRCRLDVFRMNQRREIVARGGRSSSGQMIHEGCIHVGGDVVNIRAEPADSQWAPQESNHLDCDAAADAADGPRCGRWSSKLIQTDFRMITRQV